MCLFQKEFNVLMFVKLHLLTNLLYKLILYTTKIPNRAQFAVSSVVIECYSSNISEKENKHVKVRRKKNKNKKTVEEVKKGCTDTTFIILQLNSLGGHDHYCLCLVYFLVGMTSTSGLRGRLIRDLSHSTCIQVKKGCVFCVLFF